MLGPNGAGKTSTINMLIGLARIDGGSVFCGELEYDTQVDGRAQRLMGIVPDESNLYDEMTGFDNLAFCGALYGMPKADRLQRAGELIELVGLEAFAQRSFRKYSRGMKRKLTIAAALMHEPKILFLDETTTGLDVVSAREIRGLIKELNAAGTTIFLTTHYIEEAEQLCHRVAFLLDGRIIRCDDVVSLMEAATAGTTVQFAVAAAGREAVEAAASALRSAFPEYRIDVLSETEIRLQTTAAVNLIPLLMIFEELGQPVFEAKILRPSLEDVFVDATGLTAAKMAGNSGGGRSS